jgi:two-component system, OmpR family, sensor histidine kinase KdpD
MSIDNSSDHILVVLEAHPESTRLLRAAKGRAKTQNKKWEVLIVETPSLQRKLSAHSRELLLNLSTLAEQMGANVVKVYAKNMTKGVVDYVEQRKKDGVEFGCIKLAETKRTRGKLLRQPLWKKLSKYFDNKIFISTVPVGIKVPAYNNFMEWFHFNKSDFIFSIITVFCGIVLITVLQNILPDIFNSYNRNKIMIFLIACLISSVRYGFVAGLITSALSFLSLKFLYFAPYYSFKVESASDALTLCLFVIGGIVVSFVGNNNYGSRMNLAKRSDRFNSLLSVHRLVLNKNTQAEAIEALEEELKKMLRTDVVFFLPSLMDSSMLETVSTQDPDFNEDDNKALNVCWLENKTTGVGAPYQPKASAWRFEPLSTAHKEIGVLAVHITEATELDEDFGKLLSGIADQTALILERLEFERIMEVNKVHAEREKLRAMLLSSVSHDLKTPLASVIGSLSVYRSMGKTLPEEHRITLINTALTEAQRLDSFITNILDMTRIETGQIEMHTEWTDPAAMIEEVTTSLRDRLDNHIVNIFPYNYHIEVMIDRMMTGQVVQNLLDNAAKYTEEGTEIDIEWKVENNNFILTIRDHGIGIPERELEKIFDKYSRIKKQDSQVAGTGLGLAISRAVIEAQGGTIRAYNHEEGGAVFEIALSSVRYKDSKEAA